MFFFKNDVMVCYFFFANSFSHSYPVYPLRSAKNVEMAPSVKQKMKGLLNFKQGLSSLLSICSLDYLRKISKTKSRETQIFIQDSPMAPSFLLNHLVALTIWDNFVRTSTQLVNTDTFTLPLMKDRKSWCKFFLEKKHMMSWTFLIDKRWKMDTHLKKWDFITA